MKKKREAVGGVSIDTKETPLKRFISCSLGAVKLKLLYIKN